MSELVKAAIIWKLMPVAIVVGIVALVGVAYLVLTVWDGVIKWKARRRRARRTVEAIGKERR